ncbi:sigma-70 family RNA polymerase sigma factor [Qipengyuania flava]|nr:sigma-70 family RNA polymerase sigma factor [Qipengyuania flava]
MSLSRDIVLVSSGDRDAFRRIYAQSANKLFAICFGITRNHAAAEDLLQETYVKIWDRAGGYDPERSRPLAWLCAIARNTAIDWYRRQPKHSHVGDETLKSRASEATAADDRIIDMDRERETWKAVGELDSESEIELKSIFILGLTYPEAAERLNLPIATFKSRVRRTVLRLRKKLTDD